MREAAYELYDVFTDRPFGGNPLAVFLDPGALDAAQMQTLAGELNLSECAFVLPTERPDCDVRVRIFTPGMELPMAGHPTVGTAFALAAAGRFANADGSTEIAFEEGVGRVPVRVESVGGRPVRAAMQQCLPEIGEPPVAGAEAAALLGLDADDLDPAIAVFRGSAGVPFLYVPVRDLRAAARASLRLDLWRRHLDGSSAPHVIVFCRETAGEGCDAHVRMFSPPMQIAEDPATGAAAGPLAVRLGAADGVEGARLWVIEQGLEMGRPSRLEVQVVAGETGPESVRVGGAAVRVGGGAIRVPERGMRAWP